MSKSASFDVFGTCFGFEKPIAAIEERMGPRLRRANVDARSLFFSWFFTVQRDFGFTSMAGKYVPIATIFQHTFNRACRVVEIPEKDAPTPDDVKFVMEAVKNLSARPGLKKCFDGLRNAGWDVYGVTNGGHQLSINYYKLADIELAGDHLISCDDIGVAKPDVRVYANANQRFDAKGLGAERWFVSAHGWDLLAAKKAGFKTAYLYVEEHDPATEVFGEFDLYAEGHEELLEKLTNVRSKL